MRTIGQLRNSGTRRTPRRIALIGAAFGVLAATLSLGVAASGRVTTQQSVHPDAAHTTADASSTTTNSYSGGRLMTADPNGGYWTVNWVGVVTAHGGAPSFGSPAASGVTLAKPIVAMAATPDGQGYWLVGSDGGVFAYGDANFYGSTGAIHLNEPIVGMAATPDGKGYWLVASDGGIFTYGDAVFYGSTGAIHLNEPIVGMALSPDGGGYWLVASDGGIFTFGDAPFDGSLGASSATVLGLLITAGAAGYTLVETDGRAVGFPLSAEPSSSPSASSAGSSVSNYSTQPTVSTATPDAAQAANDCQPASTLDVSTDSSLTDALANEDGPGWVGGDATYSTELPDGREAFDFSDTLVGTAQPDGAASLTGFIHNSELVGSLPDLSTDVGGTVSNPQTLIPDAVDPADQWQVAGTDVENGVQLVFVNEFAPIDPGAGIDAYTGHSGIAVMSIPADGVPAYSSFTPLPTDPDTQWGNAVLQSGAYTYVYGSDINTAADAFYGMKVARVPLGQSLDTGNWQYWNGTNWVSGEANAVPVRSVTVLTGVTAQLDGIGYEAVSIPGWSGGDTTVDLSYACSPQGPWSAPVAVYTIPQVTEYPAEMAYIPTFHPELSNHGSLVVSYNVNSTAGLTALEGDVHEYQPQFLQLTTGS
jgi:hypothetical protein